MTKQISSLQNPFVKELISLKEKSRSRRKIGKFLIEGRKEIDLAIKGGYYIECLIYNPNIISASDVTAYTAQLTKLIEVSNEVYERLAYRESTQGVLAVAKSKELMLTNLVLKREHPLILVAEAPEKPGNIGALLRTADAANVDAVIIANPRTDIYNPNIIRSSVGCVFTNQIATGSTQEIIDYLKANNVHIFCAALQASETYHTQDYTKSTAIVVGTESTGLTNEWLSNSTQNIIIPMQGEIDSMNVSVSAAIIIFEAKRQRQFRS